MTDDLDIRSGGAVAVDTATLTDAASRFDAAAAELGHVASMLLPAQLRILDLQEPAIDVEAACVVVVRRLESTQAEARAIAERLRVAAAVYEVVELGLEREVAGSAGDDARVAVIDARLHSIDRAYPDAAAEAGAAIGLRGLTWGSDLVSQASLGGLLGGAADAGPGLALFAPFSAGMGLGAGLGAVGLAGAATVGGRGRVTRGDVLVPGEGRATVAAVGSAPGRAPATLRETAERIPGGGSARVRIERYAMPGGARQWAVYIAGTQGSGIGGREAWDNRSNAELYTGTASASYIATVAAMKDADIRPGEPVTVVGFSQGGMIGAHLAAGEEFDVTTLVTLGSPVEAALGDGTLSVGIRHTDDPVAVLAGGGHLGSAGGPESIIVERTSDDGVGTRDLTLPAHRLDAYAETAGMVDASSDPRVEAVREWLAGLDQAESVDVTEYAAERPPTPVRTFNGGRSWGGG